MSLTGISMKVGTQLALGLLALATGCASHPQNIAFSDEAEIRAAHAGLAGSLIRKLDKADETQIELVAFSYLLEQHLVDVTGCPAVFLQADEAQVAALMKKYPDHLPPIKPGDQALITDRHAPVDKASNKPALVLSAEVTEPNANGTVDVAGRWSIGEMTPGFRVLRLKKTGADWQITEVK